MSGNAHHMSLFPKHIHRIGFLYPKSHFSPKIVIGLDSSFQDFVDFRGREMESTYSQILKSLKNNFFPRENLLRRILPRAVSNHLPLKFLEWIKICCSNISFRGHFFCDAESTRLCCKPTEYSCCLLNTNEKQKV